MFPAAGISLSDRRQRMSYYWWKAWFHCCVLSCLNPVLARAQNPDKSQLPVSHVKDHEVICGATVSKSLFQCSCWVIWGDAALPNAAPHADSWEEVRSRMRTSCRSRSQLEWNHHVNHEAACWMLNRASCQHLNYVWRRLEHTHFIMGTVQALLVFFWRSVAAKCLNKLYFWRHSVCLFLKWETRNKIKLGLGEVAKICVFFI